MGSLQLVEAGLYPLDDLRHDILALGIFTDQRPLRGLAGYLDWRMHGRISALLQQGFLTGDANDHLLSNTNGRIGTDRLLVVGMGRSAALDVGTFGTAMKTIRSTLTGLKIDSVALAVPGWEKEEQVYEAKGDVKLALLWEEIVQPFRGPITLFLPRGTNIKDVDANMQRIRQRLHHA